MSVRIETDQQVCTVIIDRHERRNAVDRETAGQLAQAFADFERNPALAVAVLWGAGETFCAGADLKAAAEGHGNRVTADGDGPMGPTRMQLSKPVLAAVEGHAVAGGLELALWCDMRVAARSAVFGVFCRRWGVPLVDGGTVRLPRVVGAGRAMDMILTGRPVAAEEALAMGLADRVVDNGFARREAESLAAQIASFPPECMRADRASAQQQWSLDENAALANEYRHGMKALNAGEALEGAARFSRGAGRHGSFNDLG
ncbi:MAG: crotonase/enoyl-CoA hydratase family protein [Proteobacteria bacterium]|nr:crotonase/enoyl-CoA hydratase family protein [Pseudomonadota bacterium]